MKAFPRASSLSLHVEARGGREERERERERKRERERDLSYGFSQFV